MSLKIIGVIAAVLLAAGGGTYFVLNKNDSKSSGTQKPAVAVHVGEKTEINKASIEDLITKNDNLKCTFSYTDETGGKTAGTIYTANKKVRSDMTFQAEGEEPEQYGMIRDSEYLYSWTDATKEGFKTKLSSMNVSDEGRDPQTEAQPGIDQDQQYDLDCSDWQVDSSVFEVPGNVKFRDFSKEIEQSRQMLQNSQQQMQNACSQISDPDAHAACEKNL